MFSSQNPRLRFVVIPVCCFFMPNFSLRSQWITWATLSCLHALKYFCASEVHSATRWLTVSSLSLHILHVDMFIRHSACWGNILIVNWLLYTVCSQSLVLCGHDNTFTFFFWLTSLQPCPRIQVPNFLATSDKLSMEGFFAVLSGMIVYL